MTLPDFSLTTQDGNIGVASAAVDKPLYFGPCSAGTANTRYTFSQIQDVKSELGHGPLVEALCHKLQVAGGSVDAVKTAASVAGSSSSVTQSGTGPVVSVAGSPNDFYDAIVRIRAAGALGTGTFDFTLDGKTFSEVRTIPAGATFVVPNTGLTLTFATGDYVQDETYSFTSTPATYNATDLDAAVDVALTLSDRWSFVVFTGHAADGATAATLASAIDGHMQSFENVFKYMRTLLSAGEDTAANVDTAFGAVADQRLGVVFSRVRIPTKNSFEGWGQPLLPFVYAVAARCAEVKASTSPAWVQLGGLTGVSDPAFDEFKNGEVLHNKKIMAPRTYIGASGVFITNGLLKSPLGSDFKYWQWGRVFDIACTTLHDALLPYTNSSPRTKTDGTGSVDQRDAARVNKRARQALKTALLDPVTDEGTKGYVSAVSFAVDETNDLLSTGVLQGNGGIVPRSQSEKVSIAFGLQRAVTEEAA